MTFNGASLNVADLESARKFYKKAEEDFERIRSCYSGFYNETGKEIRQEDKETLDSCIEVILDLSRSQPVRDEIKRMGSINETLFMELQTLQFKMLDYLSDFDNTGIDKKQRRLYAH